MDRPSFLRGGSVAALALVLSACGGSPTSGPPSQASGSGEQEVPEQQANAVAVYERMNGMTGQERTDALVACAEEEGALSIYTSNNDIEDLVDAFEDSYDIDVSAYRANSETVLQRLLQEQQANFYGADVVETNAAEMNVLNEEGLLAPYESELRDKVRPEGQKENWTANRFNAFVVGWNTEAVPPGEEPKSFEELADPKWKNRISMEIGDVDWYAGLTEHWKSEGKSQEEIDAIFNGMAANAKIVKGHTVQVELMGAGQFDVAVSAYSSSVDNAAQKGMPVAWKPAEGEPVQPIVVRANGVGLIKNATNPCSAVLFTDFALTDGQAVLEESMRIPSVPGGFDPIAGLQVVEVPEEDLLANPKEWDERYAAVTQRGSQEG